ncbi:MAG TPA: peptide deformylase [Candidatus Saccharimonadia bacterium]|nr:peptide deformylase [Candidatus Saccharimonadia bacterium]
MRKHILTVPNPLLRQKSTPVDLSDTKLLAKLVSDLGDTLVKKANPKGVGLADPQIGKNLRMFSTYLQPSLNSPNSGRADPDEAEASELKIYINPKILAHSKAKTFGPDIEDPLLEGCLSIPGIYGPVPRYEWVTVSYTTPELKKVEEKLHGFYARVAQHEFDHLEGILFTDYILALGLPLYEFRNRKMIEIDSELARAY